jgi:tRNA threonylcarbamoyladenosine biosynthesis protein TsaE
VIVNIYRRPDNLNLFHLDAYRLQNAAEAEELDIDLMLEQGALVVQRPEHINGAFPVDCLKVELRWIADEQRGMVFIPSGERYEKLLTEFRRKTWGG